MLLLADSNTAELARIILEFLGALWLWYKGRGISRIEQTTQQAVKVAERVEAKTDIQTGVLDGQSERLNTPTSEKVAATITASQLGKQP
jgi:hypothetical protein